jgi:hypothetical protein
MANEIRAMLSWVPFEKGGRRSAPPGPTYSTLVRFQEDKGWPATAWSLSVDYIRSYAGGQYLYARVSFLSPDAPSDLLHEGSRFELYEGRRLVAIGLVRAGDVAPAESNEFERTLLH